MGELIRTFTFERNAYRASAEGSAELVANTIRFVQQGKPLVKTESNALGALISHVGIFVREDGVLRETALARTFLDLYSRNGIDSWRWLIARSLWRFVIPNDTENKSNGVANRLGISFSFFQTILGVLQLLASRPDEERFLYYEELYEILDEDENWALDATGIYLAVLERREQHGIIDPVNARGLLEDLDNQYRIPKDNFSGLFRKAFAQTGLFEFVRNNGRKQVGIALSATLDPVLQRRMRFMLDNPVMWDSQEEAWSDFLELHEHDLPQEVSDTASDTADDEEPTVDTPPAVPIDGIVEAVRESFGQAGMLVEDELVRRFVTSLLAKRFVILTGMSGSGKTKLAQAFAAWISQRPPTGVIGDDEPPEGASYELVSVGADWTSNENILGYADALNYEKYVRTASLDLILKARDRGNIPHFLLLDEMNLSHVERYFADMLSAIESGEGMRLHGDIDAEGNPASRDGVPPTVKVPPNLFVVGTVNVDETTYMFSPKVLDRSNVIEFRVSDTDMASFLADPKAIDFKSIAFAGAGFAEALVAEARGDARLDVRDAQKLSAELRLFFGHLSDIGAEFGFRTAHEIARFVYFHQKLKDDDWDFRYAMDAQVIQKLLPKLYGSRRKLEPVLCALGMLCYEERRWEEDGTSVLLGNEEDLREKVGRAASLEEDYHLLFAKGRKGGDKYSVADSYYRLSFDKIRRMLALLDRNGFVSFAEA
jgi:energy-coupling factor transporter ATP-binding protein EcfA2